MKQADIGLIGLAVMGENLALNMESRGFTVALWNRTAEKVERFIGGRGAGKAFVGCRTPEELVSSLKRPRIVFMMVQAGRAVDEVIARFAPLMEPGDVLIDGGNSHYPDTGRRADEAEKKGLLYVGTGVSGGEEGALKGPSLMPGGSPEAWPLIRPVFEAIAAKTDGGTPCCGWVGRGGAGHFVKMVHNGIEYGDMQLICEAYQLLREGAGFSPDELRETFSAWNRSELESYLIGITAEILGRREEDGTLLLDHILDTAGQKGTGKWTAIEALDEGVPLPLITEAVFARCLSARRDERLAAAACYPKAAPAAPADKAAFAEDVRRALLASKIVSYTQGFDLMKAASDEKGWQIDRSAVALMWRGGCIIRSAFLGRISEAFGKKAAPESLLLDGYFREKLLSLLPAWRRTVSYAAQNGLPAPAFSSALSWFDGAVSPRLPAALLQAQRDYFGAHRYERTDAPRGTFFHTDWTGLGGESASGIYTA